jgi:hypothetical protein
MKGPTNCERGTVQHLLFVLLSAYMWQVRAKRPREAVDLVMSGAEAVADQTKTVVPVTVK